MKRITILLIAAFFAGMSTSAVAVENSWENEAKDAWIDGKAEATLLFNGNLNSFNINTDVEMGNVTLTGKVGTEVEKKLAQELILGIDGVESVNNQLTVMTAIMDNDTQEASRFTDAKINTVITSRFLFDSELSATRIDVDVDNRKVTLNGKVSSKAARDLALNIAKNTDDVTSVIDKLIIENDTQ